MTLRAEPTEVLTPRARTTLRRASFWIVAAVVVLVVGIGSLLLQRAGQSAAALDPASPAPAGAKAVAEVLRQQGVDVVATSSLADTIAAAGDPDTATILLYDRDLILAPDQRAKLFDLTTRLVVVEPGVLDVAELAPGVSHAGAAAGPFDADCGLGAVERAGRVVADGVAYRIDGGSGTGCLADGDRYALVETRSADTDVVVLGLGEALSNAQIPVAGNAALALGLLGERERLVWYIPGVDDLPVGAARPSIAELTPPWVTPLAILGVLVFVAIAVWRGRRMGPPVVERLPVTVRASETMEGRARLYARAQARGRALDALRIGAVGRLARRCGLPRTAGVVEVVDAVAALTGRDRATVAALLVDREPHGDRELVDLAAELGRLEQDAERAARAR